MKILNFFKKKQPEENNHIITQTVLVSYGELIYEYDTITGATKLKEFNCQFIVENKYPKIWCLSTKTKDIQRFHQILTENLPYNGRKELIPILNQLIYLVDIGTCSYNQTQLVPNIGKFLSDDWDIRLNLLNIFLESTLQWLRESKEQFKAKKTNHPELKLTNEEFEILKKQMLQ